MIADQARAFDYPALYNSANVSSRDFQSRYFRLAIFEYVLLTCAAIASMNFFDSKLAYYLYAFVFIILFVVLGVKAATKPEQGWYRSRALAESVKTMAWRYCMRSAPFRHDSDRANRDEFRRFLSDILNGGRLVGGELSPDFAAQDQITRSMCDLRLETLKNRKILYLQFRINEQRAWYKERSIYNKKSAIFWFGMCAVVYLFAISLVLGRLANEEWNFWPFEPLIVVAGSIIGWMQIKRYNELAVSYTLTAHEIGILATRIDDVDDEVEFSEFINDAELAFSREHTQWVARQEAR